MSRHECSPIRHSLYSQPSKSPLFLSWQKTALERLKQSVEPPAHPVSRREDLWCLSGSGTTLIAAETGKRACLAMELDPAYVDVAVQRWEAFTGQAATLEGDGQSYAALAMARKEAGA